MLSLSLTARLLLLLLCANCRYMVQQLKEYDGKKLRDASKEELELLESDEEKRQQDEERKELEATAKAVKAVLGDRVNKVTVSHRITRSPCVLVTAEHGWSANMERIMKAQAFRDTSLSSFRVSKKVRQPLYSTARTRSSGSTSNTASPYRHFTSAVRPGSRAAAGQTMELNPRHRLVKALKQRVDEGRAGEREVRDLVWLLYDTALLVSGFSLPDPAAYASRIHNILALGFGLATEPGDDEQQGSETGRNDKMSQQTARAGKDDDVPPLIEEQQATVMEEVD